MTIRFRHLLIPALAAGFALIQPSPASAQPARVPVGQGPSQTVVSIEQPDAGRTRDELSQLLNRYPPTLHTVLQMDPTLLGNQAYLAPYPGLVTFLAAHPEVSRNPVFYIGAPPERHGEPEPHSIRMWRDIFAGFAVAGGFAMAISLIVWLIRTFIDYRRWSRLAKVQTDVHTKLLDRFTANEDLLNYMQTPAGSKFLESSPIKLDSAPKAIAAPIARIMWSLQGGLVIVAGGIGLMFVSGTVGGEAGQPLNALGILALALGIGFVISAIISYVISKRLGLIEPPSA